MNKRYQIQHETSATMNSAAYITCPRRGKIVSVTWLICANSVDNDSSLMAELSFASVGQHSVNDPIGIISGAGWYGNTVSTANGTSVSSGQVNFQDQMELAVLPGDRIIYNAVVTAATGVWYVRILVEIDEN